MSPYVSAPVKGFPPKQAYERKDLFLSTSGPQFHGHSGITPYINTSKRKVLDVGSPPQDGYHHQPPGDTHGQNNDYSSSGTVTPYSIATLTTGTQDDMIKCYHENEFPDRSNSQPLRMGNKWAFNTCDQGSPMRRVTSVNESDKECSRSTDIQSCDESPRGKLPVWERLYREASKRQRRRQAKMERDSLESKLLAKRPSAIWKQEEWDRKWKRMMDRYRNLQNEKDRVHSHMKFQHYLEEKKECTFRPRRFTSSPMPNQIYDTFIATLQELEGKQKCCSEALRQCQYEESSLDTALKNQFLDVLSTQFKNNLHLCEPILRAQLESATEHLRKDAQAAYVELMERRFNLLHECTALHNAQYQWRHVHGISDTELFSETNFDTNLVDELQKSSWFQLGIKKYPSVKASCAMAAAIHAQLDQGSTNKNRNRSSGAEKWLHPELEHSNESNVYRASNYEEETSPIKNAKYDVSLSHLLSGESWTSPVSPKSTTDQHALASPPTLKAVGNIRPSCVSKSLSPEKPSLGGRFYRQAHDVNQSCKPSSDNMRVESSRFSVVDDRPPRPNSLCYKYEAQKIPILEKNKFISATHKLASSHTSFSVQPNPYYRYGMESHSNAKLAQAFLSQAETVTLSKNTTAPHGFWGSLLTRLFMKK